MKLRIPRPPEPVRFEARIEPGALAAARAGASVTARVARIQTDLATRISDTAWSALHALGAHRWREGYETRPRSGHEPLSRVAVHRLRRPLGGLVARTRARTRA